MKARTIVYLLIILSYFHSVLFAEEKQKPLPREFMSDNGMYIVKVEYEDWGGKGTALLTLKNKDNKVLSKFTSVIAPYKLYISSNGKVIVALCGDWSELVFINKICFFSFEGKIIKQYDVEITAFNGKFSLDNNYFVLSCCLVDICNLQLFQTITGDEIWRLPIDIRADSIAISEHGDRILIVGAGERQWEMNTVSSVKYKLMLFDKLGKLYWEKIEELSPGKIIRLSNMNKTGTIIEVKEIENRFDNELGIYKQITTRKNVYTQINNKNNTNAIMFLKQDLK